MASSDCLTTPSNDMPNASGRGADEPKQQRQDFPGNSQSPLPPEAGLHRDGEQARLVEAVRQRQQQERQLNEETTFQWLEESAAQFWDSILVYGGLIDDPRNDPMHRSRHPVNPYRDHSMRGPSNVRHQVANDLHPSSSSSKPNGHSKHQSASNGATPDLSRHPRIVRAVVSALLRLLYGCRWLIDGCIAAVARLEPLPCNAGSHMYATTPEYSLQISADDILRLVAIGWVSFYVCSRMQRFVGPAVCLTCLLLLAVSLKVLGRASNDHDNRFVALRRHNAQPLTGRAKSDESERTIAPKPTTGGLVPAKGSDRHAIAIQRLQRKHPNATYAECKRFFACVKHNEEAASKRMSEFFNWRSDSGLVTVAEAESSGATNIVKHPRVFDEAFAKRDEEDWRLAAKMAISIMTKSHVTDGVSILPQIICSYEDQFEQTNDENRREDRNGETVSELPPRCRDGTRILHILPFRLDLSIATAPTYSLAAALYLDRRFSRSSTERITLFCDLRGGRGWANPTPWSTLPFVQSTASLLGSHYPERLERLVLFPMPKSAIWVWSAAQKCLDPNTSSKVVIVSAGQEGKGLPEELTNFVREESLQVLEKRRRSFFVG